MERLRPFQNCVVPSLFLNFEKCIFWQMTRKFLWFISIQRARLSHRILSPKILAVLEYFSVNVTSCSTIVLNEVAMLLQARILYSHPWCLEYVQRQKKEVLGVLLVVEVAAKVFVFCRWSAVLLLLYCALLLLLSYSCSSWQKLVSFQDSTDVDVACLRKPKKAHLESSEHTPHAAA